MRLRAIPTLLILAAVLLGAHSLQAASLLIDFATGGAPPGGAVQTDGVNAIGAGIPLKTMIVAGTFAMDGIYAVDALLSFDTGITGNFIQVSGTANGVFSTELLNGAFSQHTISLDATGTLLGVTGLGLDEKDPAFLTSLGIDPSTQWSWLGFTISFGPFVSQTDGAFFVPTSTDIGNTAIPLTKKVPEPGSILLTGVGLIGLVGIQMVRHK